MVNLKHITQANIIQQKNQHDITMHLNNSNSISLLSNHQQQSNNSINSDCTVYLGDLDMDMGERQLKDFFASSNIPVLKVVKQPHSSFAHVTFYNANVARKLLESAVISLHGRQHARVMPFNQPANFDPEANLILKNLEPGLAEHDIIAKFKHYGNILSCKLARDESGNSKCYAYLQYESRESAATVIDRLNNTYWDERCDPDFKYKKYLEKITQLKKNTMLSKAEMQMQENQAFAELSTKIGKKIYVGVFKKKNEYSKIKSSKEGKPSNLYVKNFGTNFGDRDLFNLFKAFGSIKSAKVRRMRVGLVEKPLGCGFVDFEYPQEAEKARQNLDGFQLSSGRVLSVTYADCKSRRLRKKFEQDEISDETEQEQQQQCDMMLIETIQIEDENFNSMTSTASVSPSVSPVSPSFHFDTSEYQYNSFSDNRMRNVSIGSELSTDSFFSSSSSSVVELASQASQQNSPSPTWPNLWSKLLNTSEWNEYRLFGGGLSFF